MQGQLVHSPMVDQLIEIKNTPDAKNTRVSCSLSAEKQNLDT